MGYATRWYQRPAGFVADGTPSPCQGDDRPRPNILWLMADEYRRNRITGSFLLIDEASGATVGAGMIL